MSGQVRISTSEGRKVYSICHAIVKVTQIEYHTTATHLDCLRIGDLIYFFIQPYEMDWTNDRAHS